MDYIKEKNGNKLDYQFMKQYVIEKMEQKFKDKINKKSWYVKCFKMTKKSIPELVDLVEKEFGKDGVIFLFIHEYDFTGIPDEEIDKKIDELIKQSKHRKLDLTIGEKIKFFFGDIVFWTKYIAKCFSYGLLDFITFPFKNYHHIKKYFLPKKVSDSFCLHFLIVIVRNLEYYKNNFEKIFPYEGSLSEQEKQTIQKHIDYQLAYYTLSEPLSQFDYLKDLNLFKSMDEESFIKVQDTISEIRNIKFEKNSKLITFIQEKMFY